jgi:hypothetical protein
MIWPSSRILPRMKAETDPRAGTPGAYSPTWTLLKTSVPASAEAVMNRLPIWVVMVPAVSHMLLPVSTLPQNDSADAEEMTTRDARQTRARYRYGIMISSFLI